MVPKWLDLLGKTFPNFNPYNLFKDIVYVVITIVLARLLFWFLDSALRKVFLKENGSTFILEERRAKTLYPLLRSVLFYAISFFVLLNILASLGVPTATLLASASVLGLAVGFGAQSLVKDIISGFFIIFEDQFAVGEFVKTDKFSGIVEEIGLRATKLRDWGGELHVIPNGTISSITNYNRGKMRALVDINIPYHEDFERAMEVISQAGEKLTAEDKEKIVEGPNVQGIINLGEHFMIIRVVAYTKPMEQWGIERTLRREIMHALTQAGIRVPANKKSVNVQAENEEI